VRQKPDITAADGVSVTGVGGFGSPFFGTSAAAPHAAAIAALVKSANPSLTPAQIRSILTTTAIDIEAAGVDRDSGAGIIMARDAVAATGAAGTAFLTIEAIDVTDNPGNGNHIPEVGEGARAAITLKNNGGAPATSVASTLTSSSSGVTVALPNTQTFGTLAPAASQTRSALFTTAADFGCPATALFSLTADYGGGPSPLAAPFAVPIGITSFTITRNLNGTTPPSFPSVVGSTGTQNLRLNRQDTASVCGAHKPAPPASVAGGAGARRYDSYAFTTCGFSTPSCVSVTFGGPNSINMFSAAYAPTFDANNITANYKADPAVSSSGALTYSFDIPAGSSRFAVNVNDVPPNAPSNSEYTLSVANACLGTCDPPNHPPIARAKAVTVAADPTVSADSVCTAGASVDDASTDPDGDPLTYAQSPAGPYALGTAPVLLTVTDPKGAFGQAVGAVTVVDQTAPAIAGLSLSPPALRSADHELVDVTVNYDATDNCSAATCVLTVASSAVKSADEDDHDDDDRDEPSFVVVDAHRVRLRADQSHGRDRIYTITLTCTDAAGNTTVRTTTAPLARDQEKRRGEENRLNR
jgi:subtilase family protein